MIERGGVYLANLNPNKAKEPGKVRPVIVIQTNVLNEVDHPTVIVVPLTTKIIEDTFPLRFRLLPRGELKKESDAMCDQLRAITTQRITSNKLLQRDNEELKEIEKQICLILQFEVKS